MSQGPSFAVFVPPPAPAADEPPATPAPPEPPVLVGAPATLPLPATLGPPPAPPAPPAPVVALGRSSMVPDVGYSVLFGVRVTLPPEAQYEYGASASATASVRLLPSAL